MYLGEDICLKLPKIHAVTGCDTTSFFFGVSKIKVLKKIMKDNSKLKWLDSLGESEVLSPEGLSAVTQCLYRKSFITERRTKAWLRQELDSISQ